MSFKEGNYYLKKSNIPKRINVDIIKQNLVKLYFLEPVGLNTIYCDKQNKMLKISNIGHSIYKVAFSWNNYNIFYYEKGKCILIDVVHPLFKVKLIPTI